MFRPTERGMGNILIQLAQVDPGQCVSSTIRIVNHLGKFFNLKNLKVIEDDGSLPDIFPGISIGNPKNERIRDIIEPTDYLSELVSKYSSTIESIDYGLQIRRSGFSTAKTVSKDDGGANYKFCTDATLQKFIQILETNPGNVFVTSDCYDTKKKLKDMFPERIRIIDQEPEHVTFTGDKEPWLTYVEFILLSKCPTIVMTGGDKDMLTFSTYGYTAGIYGKSRLMPIFNDEQVN